MLACGVAGRRPSDDSQAASQEERITAGNRRGPAPDVAADADHDGNDAGEQQGLLAHLDDRLDHQSVHVSQPLRCAQRYSSAARQGGMDNRVARQMRDDPIMRSKSPGVKRGSRPMGRRRQDGGPRRAKCAEGSERGAPDRRLTLRFQRTAGRRPLEAVVGWPFSRRAVWSARGRSCAHQARSKRSRFITLFQAATKSCTNLAGESWQA